MKIAVNDQHIYIKDADSVQYREIRSWGVMRWDKKTRTLVGYISLDLIRSLEKLIKLPPNLRSIKAGLESAEKGIDKARIGERPQPLYDYPVTLDLMEHQIRGANMACIQLGLLDPPEERRCSECGAVFTSYEGETLCDVCRDLRKEASDGK